MTLIGDTTNKLCSRSKKGSLFLALHTITRKKTSKEIDTKKPRHLGTCFDCMKISVDYSNGKQRPGLNRALHHKIHSVEKKCLGDI